MVCLLYPVGPVGCWPALSRARKSSTCSEGGREVLGGRERNVSPRGTGMARPNTTRPLIGVTEAAREHVTSSVDKQSKKVEDIYDRLIKINI